MSRLITCAKCGVSFQRRKKSRSKSGKEYCTRQCLKNEHTCKQCGKHFFASPVSRRKFCCHRCATDYNRGPNHVQWTGGRYISVNGYVEINVNAKRRFEHVIIAENALGRPLRTDEIVHHINGDKQDNRSCNLLICTKKYHTALHHRMSYLYQCGHFGYGHGGTWQ